MQELSNLMPRTEGINFFSANPDLSFILKRHLSIENYERAEVILTEMGAVASQKMDSLAEEANRQGPVLKQFDKKGARVDEVIFHPAYHELERIAYQDFAIAAGSHREGALGWNGRIPQPIKFALRLYGYAGRSRGVLSYSNDRCAGTSIGMLCKRITRAPFCLH